MNSRGSWATRHVTGTSSLAPTYSWTGSLPAALAIANFIPESTPVADRVYVRIGNSLDPYPLKVRLSNTFLTVD